MKNKLLWLCSFIAVIVIYHICYGLQTLVPTNISWLMTAMHDWGTHYLGFAFFKSEPWHFPLGATSNYFYPIGTNVGYTDSIPLLAIFFKIFAPILPDDFQYFGIWLLSCHLFTAFFTIRLLQLFKLDPLLIFLAVIFTVSNPVLVYRGLHPALCAQWMLIAAVYIYFKDPHFTKPKKILTQQLLLAVLSAWINPYICFMILGFSLITPAKLCFWDKAISGKAFIGDVVLSGISIILSWLIIGLVSFGKQEEFAVDGSYGLYGLNLNSLYNSWGFSSFFPHLGQVSWHQYEGYMYLGLGLLLLLPITIVGRLIYYSQEETKKNSLVKFSINKTYVLPLLLLSLAYAAFAITHIISINDNILLKIPIPKLFIEFGGIFRASARFFWLPYYLLFFFTFIGIARMNWRQNIKLGVVTLFLFIQLYDTKPLLTHRNLTYGSYSPPLETKNWDKLFKEFDEIVVYPPFQGSYASDLDYQFFCFLAAKAKKPITTGYVARLNNKAISAYNGKLNSALLEGELSPNTLYITTASALDAFSFVMESNVAKLNKLDAYYYFFKDQGINQKVVTLANATNAKYKRDIDSAFNKFGKKGLFQEVPRLALSEGKPIRYWIETFKQRQHYLMLNGWGFLEATSNNKGDSLFFTLNSEVKTYIINTKIKARPDITASHKKTYLDDAGFSKVGFFDNVEKGRYQLGIGIKTKDGKVFHQLTEHIAKVGIPDYVLAMPVSNLPKDGNIIYGIDQLETDKNLIKIGGWSAFENMDATNSKASILFFGKNGTYQSETETVQRPDVTTRPNNRYNLDNAGFKTQILRSSLPKGTYQVGIMIRNSKTNTEAVVRTDKYFNN